MGKNEGDSARKLVYISIGLSLGIGLVLGGVIVFLELRSELEIASLRSKVNGLIQEINTLRHNLRHLNNTVVGLDSREKSREDQNNDEEYSEYAEDYDDPNSDSYEDEEDSYNDTPAPPNLNPSSLALSDGSKNDTRPKRESTFNLNTLTKEFLPHSKTSSHGTKKDNRNSGKQSNNPSAFSLMSSRRTLHNEQLSDKILKSNTSESTFIRHAVSTNHDKIERTLNTKKKRHLRVYSSELQTTDSTHRDKRGGRPEDVEVFTRPEFPTRSGSHSGTVAAHYGADESKCKNTRHRHCDHNDRRYHPQYHLKDWQGTNWMNMLGASANFEMRDGVLVVQNSGLYFIYAQVFYADAHDVCGFRVYQNNQPILQCTTTTVHDATKNLHKRNSCFTGSLIHLQQGDELVLKETEENRYTFFERTKSFFGLFKIGNV